MDSEQQKTFEILKNKFDLTKIDTKDFEERDLYDYDDDDNEDEDEVEFMMKYDEEEDDDDDDYDDDDDDDDEEEQDYEDEDFELDEYDHLIETRHINNLFYDRMIFLGRGATSMPSEIKDLTFYLKNRDPDRYLDMSHPAYYGTLHDFSNTVRDSLNSVHRPLNNANSSDDLSPKGIH